MEPDSKNESFRDSIATIDKEGKRAWIFPKKPSGKLFNLRAYLSYVYLVIFFGLPFIKLNGEPLFLIDVLHKKFILFGMIFWSQDFFIFCLGMLIFIVFIALFTVVFGRVFCGWACPQTIFMEMLFRRIEYFVEGDGNHQRTLRESLWNKEKIIKRGIKFILFFALSYLIANTLLSYLISFDEVSKFYTEPGKHIGGLVSLGIFTFVFYFVYSYLREQVCLIVCPYGRMQGVLLDKNSIVVAYDYERGEPRHKIRKSEDHGKGDCIDCGLCVKVCPTGIDIRNGTQLECVNCTACIDECNAVMEKVNLPIGLIRYASENGIKNKQKLTITTRMKAYTGVLLVLLGIEVFLLSTRSDYDATILRAKGMLYQDQPDDKISNLYTIKLVNKTRNNLPVEIKVENYPAEIKLIGKELVVKKEAVTEGEFFVIMKKSDVTTRKSKLEIGVYSNHKKIKTVKTNFLSNVSRSK
ncbi:MAG: cytochrome c oxidase accessory protein CcoG [Bacteroidota bacterium]|nr:cytochrome c oxidase accessory protein CcoG [Bacteroidota bacterium]